MRICPALVIVVAALAAGCGPSSGDSEAMVDSGNTSSDNEAPIDAFGLLTPEFTCLGALLRTDTDLLNVLYLEEEAVYFGYPFTLLAGERIRIQGSYPRSRYMSLQVYDELYGLRDGLADVEIAPDPGSVNPFETSLDREGSPRNFTAFIKPGKPEGERERNTLYTQFRDIEGVRGQVAGGRVAGFVVWRVYVSHVDGDKTGGVPIPRIVAENRLSGQERRLSPVDCSNFQVPQPQGINEFIAGLPGLPVLEDALPDVIGLNPPKWFLYTDALPVIARAYLENQFIPEGLANLVVGLLSPDDREQAARSFSNIHNEYIVAMLSRLFGQVAVVEAVAPTYPDSRRRGMDQRDRDPTDEQVRFWSYCMYSPVLSQRFTECINDDEVPVQPDGRYRVVVSTREQRPENARVECGAAWMAWGAAPEGLLAYRHLDVRQTWEKSAHNIVDVGDEARVLQDVLPSVTYMSREEFDANFPCQ